MPTPDVLAISPAQAGTLFADLTDTKALVLAVSGGPDSTALLVLAARWAKTLKRAPVLTAVTVDHGLRPESTREARDVAKLARKLGIAHRTLRWTGKKPKAGLPQAARHARYSLLAAAAAKAGASHVLTAHTLDDQAETVLIRLLRGSGLTGLGAMKRETSLPSPSPERGGSTRAARRGGVSKGTPTRIASQSDLPLSGGGEDEAANDGILLLRPFLTVPKARLIATLQADEIPFADDPTNRDAAFTRARLRGLMPQLAGEGLDAARLALLARRLQRAESALAVIARQTAEVLTVESRPGTFAYDRAGFALVPEEIGLRLLGRAIDAMGNEGPVELAKLETLDEALRLARKAGRPFRRSLAGAIVTLTGDNAGGKIVIEKAPARRLPGAKSRRNALTKAPRPRSSRAKTR